MRKISLLLPLVIVLWCAFFLLKNGGTSEKFTEKGGNYKATERELDLSQDQWGNLPSLKTARERDPNPHKYSPQVLAVANRLEADTIEFRRLLVPSDIPEQLSVDLGEGKAELQKRSFRGENFQIVLQGENGEVTVADPGPVRTYIGRVSHQQDATMTALVAEKGFHGRIANPIEKDTLIEPLLAEEIAALDQEVPGVGIIHAFYQPLVLTNDLKGDGLEYYEEDGTLVSALGEDGELGTTEDGSVAPRVVGNVCVREAELGIDVTNRFYRERGNSSVSEVRNIMEAWMANEIRVFERDCLVRHVLGTLVIRTSSSDDPYNNDIQNRQTLTDMRNNWNVSGFPQNLVGSTIFDREEDQPTTNPAVSQHDLAILVLQKSIGVTGLASVGTVGETRRYGIITARSGLGFFRNGGQHELGHIWGLRHGTGCGEEPWINGSTGTGIICGSDQQRANSAEVSVVLAHRDSRRPGVLPETEASGPLAPYCRFDRVTATAGSARLLDVLANDFDANNDNFVIRELRTLNPNRRQAQLTPTEIPTFLGGSIIREIGTGPNGRDQILYQAPEDGIPGDIDSFYYLVQDLTGQRNWGYVEVTLSDGLLFEESFLYADGNLGGQTNSGNNWGGSGSGTTTITSSGSLDVPSIPNFEFRGAQVTQVSSSRRALALPAQANNGAEGQTIYISFIHQLLTAQAGATQIVEFWNGGASDENRTFSFGTYVDSIAAAPDYGLFIERGSSQLALEAGTPDMEPHLVVLKIEYGANDEDTVSIYIDPGVEEPETPVATIVGNDLIFNRIGMGSFQGGSQVVDEIRIGETFSVVVPVQEDVLLFSESFNYGTGNLAGNTIAGEEWVDVTGGGSTTVAASSIALSTPENLFSSGGQMVQVGSDRVSLNLPPEATTGTDGETVYISFIQQLLGSGHDRTRLVEFWDGVANDNNRRFSFGTFVDSITSAPDYGLFVESGSSSIAREGVAPDDEPHLIVMKIEYGDGNADRISFYVDPGVEEPDTPLAVVDANDLAFDIIGFGSFQGGSQAVDEIRIGQSFSSVITLITDDPFFEEEFDYGEGALAGRVNAGNQWASVGGSAGTEVVASSLQPVDLPDFITDGGSVVQTTSHRVALELPALAHGGADLSTLYVSFVQRLIGADAAQTRIIEFWNGGVSDNDTTFSFGFDTNPAAQAYGLLVDKNGSNTFLNTGPADEEAHLVVLKLTYGENDNDLLELFLDPGASEPSTPLGQVTGSNLAFDRLGFGTFQNGSQEIDSIRIGPSYRSVVPFDGVIVVDDDDDGLPDDFELVAYGNLTSTSGDDDFDNDGQSDLAEIIAGTDPQNNSSLLAFTASEIDENDDTQFILTWRSVPERDYSVWRTDTLEANSWEEIIPSIIATGTTTSTPVPLSSGRSFFQVRVQR